MKKHRVFIFAAISFVIVLSAVIFLQKNAAPTRLTTDEVAALRGQYPVCSGSPPLIETVPLSLADCAAMADTFLYGKIEGEAQYFNQSISDLRVHPRDLVRYFGKIRAGRPRDDRRECFIQRL